MSSLAARSHVVLRVDGELGSADRATLTSLLLDRGVEVSARKGEGFAGSDAAQPDALASAIVSDLPQPSSNAAPWKPWFPVIDYSRCTNCMQCLSFCLFDVYGVSNDSKIQVQNQSNCKTDCPACSRVCPEIAI